MSPSMTNSTFDSKDFRRALGSFATGVTIVTAVGADGERVGVTASSFNSLSLDPPLILWCPAKSARRTAVFAQARHFAVHILSTDQAHLCRAFTVRGDAFDLCPHGVSPEGVPVLEEFSARFECTLDATHDAGDHLIVVGRVIRAIRRPDPPLVFLGGDLGDFARRDGMTSP